MELSFSPKLNCFFGQNGMGKTNLLDAVYFLSFCKSAGNPIDSQNICHDADFFVIQGFYEAADGTPEEIYCGMKRRQKKQFKRNKKEYTRLSDHIGFLPLVMVSPADSELIAGGSDERRRFMDVVISQYDKEYLDALIRYNKALVQRNTLLKSEQPVEEELFLVWEEMMAQAGEVVFRKREAFIREFIPIFQSFYSFISQDREKVGLSYDSHARDASLLEVLKESRARDQIMGYSLRGVHKDELNMLLGDFPIKREGSQGQNKTYLVALKLAQFDFLKRTGTTVPLLLLDDIFDKLDASLAKAVMSIGAVKAFEIGDGTKVAHMHGSENNDCFCIKGDRVIKETNHSGGILGGISDGSDIVVRAGFKPTPSVAASQQTINKDGENIAIEIKGRHDPIVVARAVVVVECMTALVLADALLVGMSAKLDNVKKVWAPDEK